MRALFLSTSDRVGGAARASWRLLEALRESGVDVRLFALVKATDDPGVFTPPLRIAQAIRFIAPTLEALPLRGAPPRPILWSLNQTPYPIAAPLHTTPADLLHVHWVGKGFIPIGALGRVRRPVVWTLHDEWTFTGGCHYAFDCTRFTESCGACPQLGSSDAHDLSHRIHERKRAAWRDLDLTIIAPSAWMADRARASSLLRDRRIDVIPNAIDTSVYKPLDRAAARAALNLPPDKRVILFGALDSADDRRKGAEHLDAAIAHLAEAGWRDRAVVATFGAAQHRARSFPLPHHALGVLHDDVTLALAYAAADVFVAPSLQDNLPNTVMEALACGTPCTAFDVGGLPDLIADRENGRLAPPYSAEALAACIGWIIEDADRHAALSAAARQGVVSRFAYPVIAARHAALYQEIRS